MYDIYAFFLNKNKKKCSDITPKSWHLRIKFKNFHQFLEYFLDMSTVFANRCSKVNVFIVLCKLLRFLDVCVHFFVLILANIGKYLLNV